MRGFNVYIDESGDEGFTFRENGEGSSRWFVLAGVVTRHERDKEAVEVLNDVRRQLRKSEKYVLHFRDLKHHDRLPFLGLVGKAQLRIVAVLIYKPVLQGDHFSEKGLLYRYATRLLLERISWLCRDHRKDPAHKAHLIFSNRANMSYADLGNYLEYLKRKDEVRIDWSAIDCDRIQTMPHNKLKGLQIADAAASGLYYAVNTSVHGFSEPRYAELLRDVIYAHKGKRLGYGIKLMPKEIVGATPPTPGAEWLAGGDW